MSAAGSDRGDANAASRWGANSLRLRLLLAVLAWVGFGIGAIWYSATHVFARHVEQQYHEELAVHLQELAGLVTYLPTGTPRLVRPLSDPRYSMPLSGFYWQVSVAGEVPIRSPSLTGRNLDERIAHTPAILHHVEAGPTGPAITYGLLQRSPNGRAVHYVIATDKRFLDEAVTDFTRDLTVWLIALAAGLVATGLAVVVFAFRPLDRLANAVGRLHAGDLRAFQRPFPDEIEPLARDLNSYIEHNAAVVERARVEASSLAHSLRTPLAVITDEAERLAMAPGGEGPATVLLDQSRRMSRQIEYRLARARAAGRLPGNVSHVSTVLPPVVWALQRLHPAKRFEQVLCGDVVLPIDPVDLTEILSNLLDNAGKWAARDIVVECRLPPHPGICIIDDGPGLNDEQIAQAGMLGRRFDPEKSHSGLGLAIARDVASEYGAILVFAKRPDGLSGLQVELSWPDYRAG